MTIRELFAEFVVDREKQRHRIESDITQAWQIANFSYPRKLPNLKSYLAKVRGPSAVKPKPQTPQEMRNVLQQYGMRPRQASEQTKKSLKYIKVQ